MSMHTYMRTQIRTYIITYIHTYVHTYTYIHTYSFGTRTRQSKARFVGSDTQAQAHWPGYGNNTPTQRFRLKFTQQQLLPHVSTTIAQKPRHPPLFTVAGYRPASLCLITLAVPPTNSSFSPVRHQPEWKGLRTIPVHKAAESYFRKPEPEYCYCSPPNPRALKLSVWPPHTYMHASINPSVRPSIRPYIHTLCTYVNTACALICMHVNKL